MTARGIAVGVLGLAVLDAVISSPSAPGRLGSLLGSSTDPGAGISGFVRSFMSPTAPLLSSASNTGSGSVAAVTTTSPPTGGQPVLTAQALKNPVVASASNWIGVPYAWGGTSRAGVDCSGLVQQVLASIGIAVPRTSQAQAQGGLVVPGLASAQPGDLVFFDSDGTPNSHVGIYLGSNFMIDAPHTGEAVGVHSIKGYGNVTAVRRYLPGSTLA